MTNFYISDTHFYHKNIISLANRPYKDVDEMNAALVTNWNSVVTDNDTVYHLGDFAWSGQKENFPQLRGQKILIKGNHDFRDTLALGWSSIVNYWELNDGDKKVVLFHYPIFEWNGFFRGSVHLFGHVHGNPTKHRADSKLAFDVGVEKINYTPVTLNQLLTRESEVSYNTEEQSDVGC
jgi:calcineurin-like phosphoesterase family protein